MVFVDEDEYNPVHLKETIRTFKKQLKDRGVGYTPKFVKLTIKRETQRSRAKMLSNGLDYQLLKPFSI